MVPCPHCGNNHPSMIEGSGDTLRTSDSFLCTAPVDGWDESSLDATLLDDEQLSEEPRCLMQWDRDD